jgi:hypothetical protein
MSITATQYAIGADIGTLQTAVAAKIAAGYQPVGDPFEYKSYIVQRMDLVDGVQTEASGDGAIAIASGTVVITKGSAAALTLAAPTAAQAGTRLRIISQTAFAHVITATNLIDDGVTGGAKDTATFAAFAGAAIELEAVNQKWAVVSKNVVTVAGS